MVDALDAFDALAPQSPRSPKDTAVIDAVLGLAAAFLIVNVAISLIRVLRGPTDHDRLLAVLLMGTTAVGILALLAHTMDLPALRDAALALVALAALMVLTRTRTKRPAR